MEYRQFLEMHNNCTKALANDKAKMPSQNIDVDTGLYGQYAKFQVSFPARLVYLRSGNFQESVEPGRDKCVPPLLQKFSPKCKAGGAQPPGNYSATSSCSFGPDRIAEYEKANVAFKNDMRMSGPVSIPKLRALLEHDIAYFHLRIVKWKPKEAAHLAGKVQHDDDDPPGPGAPSGVPEPDMDFLTWDALEIDKIPWKHMGYSLTDSPTLDEGDMPLHTLPGLLIALHAQLLQIQIKPSNKLPEDLDKFFLKCRDQIEDGANMTMREFLNLGKETRKPTNNWQAVLRKREFSAQQLEYIKNLWEMVNQEYLANEDVLSSAANPVPVVEGEADAGSDDEGIAAAASRALRSATPKQPRSNQPVTPVRPTPIRPTPGRPRSSHFSEGAQSFKRKKSIAYVKTVASPASLEPIVRSDQKKRRRSSGQRGEVAPTDDSIPKSETTGRILVGELSLNKLFPKNYSSPDAPKTPPVVNMTLSQAWHVVSCPPSVIIVIMELMSSLLQISSIITITLNTKLITLNFFQLFKPMEEIGSNWY